MKLRQLIGALAALVFSIAWLINPLSALAKHHKGVVTLPAISQDGVTLANPFGKPAVLTIYAEGEWNFRRVDFTNGDANGYAKGSCDESCYAPDVIPGRLLTLDSATKKLLNSGKVQAVELAPHQEVILVMNDLRDSIGYTNNSGEQKIGYMIKKVQRLLRSS